jgi:hypothetical protein
VPESQWELNLSNQKRRLSKVEEGVVVQQWFRSELRIPSSLEEIEGLIDVAEGSRSSAFRNPFVNEMFYERPRVCSDNAWLPALKERWETRRRVINGLPSSRRRKGRGNLIRKRHYHWSFRLVQ